MEPLVLTFDVGTQSLRAILVRKDGTFLDAERVKYAEPYYSTGEFRAEQRPRFYYECLVKASNAVLARNPEAKEGIRCVTVTTFRDSVLCLDENMEPVGDMIHWLDKREADYEPSKIPAAYKALFALVGMTDTIEYQYRDAHCNWIMQKDPERWAKTRHFVYIGAYLVWLLTGELCDSCASTVGHMPYDYKKRAWMKKSGLTYSVYAVPREKLCEVKEPGEVLGRITARAAAECGIPEGLPLIGTASDKACETVGLSVQRPGAAALSFGTAATVQIVTDRYVEPAPFLPAYPSPIPGRYHAELQIYRGYWMLTWFIREFCEKERLEALERGIRTERVMDEHLAQVPAGSGGLLVQPYWTPGVATPNARGSMVGFTDRQNKYYLYRALIEGLNFELMEGLRGLEKQSGIRVTELWAAGGGSRSPEILQITADMFGLPVKLIQTPEASGLGSAMAGFVAAGEFADFDEATAAMVREGEVYRPDPEAHKVYEQLFEVYDGIYGSLKKLYKKEKKIFRKLSR